MLPLLRHEVDLWLKTVWGLLKPYEDRMTLDAFKQVTGRAGDYQVEGARTVQTLNIGGSTTTTVSLIVGV